MKISKLALAAILAPLLALPMSAQSETVRDCVVEGTVKRQQGKSENVYVAFHSAKPAEKGASCRLDRREKLKFKAPNASELKKAEPGTRVRYRYTEDSEKGATWKRHNASS
jgi:hypothetical protein